MTKQEAIDELLKHYVPEYVNYIVTALTDGATPSDAPTINAIPIPKDATNGDVIRAIFPDFGEPHFCGMKKYMYDTTWWNAPYKKEAGD